MKFKSVVRLFLISALFLFLFNYCGGGDEGNNESDAKIQEEVKTDASTNPDVAQDTGSDEQCIPLCESEGWECGDDGCEGSCGTCGDNQQCIDHHCVTCDCGTKECGTDECGNPCGDYNGDCPEGKTCNADGMCVECTPQCEGKECGPDGCGGTCGTCDNGFQCNNEGKCVQVTEKQPFGGSCGPTEQCQPPSPEGLSEQEYEQKKNEYWACLNAQCEGGNTALCWDPYCTKLCTIHKDSINNTTGEQVADGIEDPDTSVNDCVGAVDGPVGTKFTCAIISSPGQGPYAICYPGSLIECTTSADCPEGEACGMALIKGEYQKRCQTKVKDGSDTVGAYCNSNPVEGDVAFCSNNFCFTLGCSAFCAEDSDCLTENASCDTNSGTCKNNPDVSCTSDADCSAWLCEKDMELGPNWKDDVCFPRECKNEYSCNDPDFFCRPFIAEDYSGFTGYCAQKMENSVAMGEPCDENPFDNIPGDPCQNPYLCIDGYCGGMCETDSDCATDKSQECAVVFEYPLDANDDGNYDYYLPLKSCLTFPYDGDATECTVDSDCGDNGVCKYYEKGDTSGNFKLVSRCVNKDENKGNFGDLCGGQTGGSCNSGFCLGADQQNPGYCASICSTKSDCPETVTIGQATYKTICRALLWGWNGTEDPNDDLYIPLCLLTSDSDSLTDCSDTFTCNEGETCAAFPIATNPDTPSKVEFYCISNPDATKDAGEECNPNPSEDSTTVECKDIYCLPDKVKGKGYCSKLCKDDNDCPEGLSCLPKVLIPRENPDYAATIKLCQKVGTCIPCDSNADCIDGYVCANVGGMGFTSDYRCVPACETDGDCTGEDGSGTKCVESKDKDGNPEGIKGCIPDSCE